MTSLGTHLFQVHTAGNRAEPSPAGGWRGGEKVGTDIFRSPYTSRDEEHTPRPGCGFPELRGFEAGPLAQRSVPLISVEGCQSEQKARKVLYHCNNHVIILLLGQWLP